MLRVYKGCYNYTYLRVYRNTYNTIEHRDTIIAVLDQHGVGDLYRGYSFLSAEDRDALMTDTTPFNPYHKTGEAKGRSENFMGETYFGTYTTWEKDQAEAYARRHAYGILVTFDWDVITSLYLSGSLNFEQSNDIAYATNDLCNTAAMREVLDGVQEYIEIEELDDVEKIPDDALLDWCSDPRVFVLYSALYGRNKEILLSSKDSDHVQEGWTWSAVKSVEKINTLTRRN